MFFCLSCCSAPGNSLLHQKGKRKKKKPAICLFIASVKNKKNKAPPTNIGKLILCRVYGDCRCSPMRDLQQHRSIKMTFRESVFPPSQRLECKTRDLRATATGEICQIAEGYCTRHSVCKRKMYLHQNG